MRKQLLVNGWKLPESCARGSAAKGQIKICLEEENPNGGSCLPGQHNHRAAGRKIAAMSPHPAAYHNMVAERIDFIFRLYLRGKKCVPLGDGYDVYLTPKDRFVPDFMVVCNPDKIKFDGVHGAPDLVVEVLSPGTAKNDKTYKKDVYAQGGVREYWIVSPEEGMIEQYLLQGGELALKAVYTAYANWMLNKMTEKERAAIVKTFKCSLFDDLEISLDDIFYDLL